MPHDARTTQLIDDYPVPPTSPLTIPAQRPYPPALGRLPEAAPFRVGFHKLAVSGRGPWDRLPRPFPASMPLAGAGVTLVKQSRRKRRPTKNFTYTRMTRYVVQPQGHKVTVFTEPLSGMFPALHVKLVPVPGALFTPMEAVGLIEGLARALRFPLRLSAVELAADCRISVHSFERLGGWFWPARVVRWRRRGPQWPRTFYWGSGRSGRQVKLYWKRDEPGDAVARLEFTFRRGLLKAAGLDRPRDLLAADWAGLAARCGRFVELDFARARHLRFLRPLRSVALLCGLPAAQRMMERRRLREHLVDLPVQRNLEDALARLSVPASVGRAA